MPAPDTTEEPIHREETPEPPLAPEEADAPSFRERVIATAPCQTFWTKHDPPEVDAHAAWKEALRQGVPVVRTEDAAKALAP